MIYNVMATAKHWNRMSKNDQNTCLETPDTTPMQGWDTLLCPKTVKMMSEVQQVWPIIAVNMALLLKRHWQLYFIWQLLVLFHVSQPANAFRKAANCIN
jgi:hypothetical protein